MSSRNRTQRRAAAKAASKVKEDSSEEDGSEWEESEEPSMDVDDDHDEEEEFEEEDAAPPQKKRAVTKKKSKAAVKQEEDDDDDDLLPTYARLTAKGGYSHTNKSRARISKANKGNTPWNKGKNRSDAVKAKIAAGVRGRNRALLMAKLEKMGMTEEEWLAKKKEIKYLRERVRKAKRATEKRETKKKGRSPKKTYEELQDELAAKLAEQMQAMEPDNGGGKDVEQKVAPNQTKEALLQKVFSSHVEWTPHDYDTHERLYEQLCPTGGPGGLVCCEVCSTAYSRYLNQTSSDLDTQTVHQTGKEVQELVGFMQETRGKLETLAAVARQQPPPLKCDVARGSTTTTASAPVVKLTELGQTASI